MHKQEAMLTNTHYERLQSSNKEPFIQAEEHRTTGYLEIICLPSAP